MGLPSTSSKTMAAIPAASRDFRTGSTRPALTTPLSVTISARVPPARFASAPVSETGPTPKRIRVGKLQIVAISHRLEVSLELPIRYGALVLAHLPFARPHVVVDEAFAEQRPSGLALFEERRRVGERPRQRTAIRICAG